MVIVLKLSIDRHLLGEELSGLAVRDLQFLQSQVEMSLQSIRKTKVTYFLLKKLWYSDYPVY
jgi:hypothetical protein